MNNPITKNKAAAKENNAADAAKPCRYVGLDVHKRQITWCIIDSGGNTLTTGELALSAISLESFAELKLQPSDRVVLERQTRDKADEEGRRRKERPNKPFRAPSIR